MRKQQEEYSYYGLFCYVCIVPTLQANKQKEIEPHSAKKMFCNVTRQK